jgi:hypothetical protein
MIHLAIITAVFLSAFIEGIRIEGVKGKVFNVKKWVSVLIGAALFGVVLLIFGLNKWYFILPEMLFLRATLYDPVLNRLRGLKWAYVSTSTNSWLDRLEAKIGLHFVAQRVLYGIISTILILLYELR